MGGIPLAEEAAVKAVQPYVSFEGYSSGHRSVDRY